MLPVCRPSSQCDKFLASMRDTKFKAAFAEHEKSFNPNQFKHPFSDTKSLDRVAPSGYNEQPVEWIAKAGDLILWHHWTMHIGSMNVNSSPRLGLFARYHHRDWFQMRMDKGGIRSDGDLWKYWSPEVRQVRESYGALSKL